MLRVLIPVIALIIICITILIVLHMSRKPPKVGDSKLVGLAQEAAHLFSDMRVPYTMSQMDTVDLLTDDTKHRVDAWLVRYKKEINK